MTNTDTDTPDVDGQLAAWFAGRLPDGWFTAVPDVRHDRDEILVVGTLAAPATDGLEPAAVATAEAARIQGWRDDTRALRMRVADEAEARFGRKVAWGARCGDTEELFTLLSIPVMTRLRLNERQVLDTLVDAGVARSRSHALAWCVKLVSDHEGDWITELREALVHVEKVRSKDPTRKK